MLVPIIMPQLGESMAEATVVSLLIQPGQQVKADQDLLEVETNKAVFQVGSSCEGTIQKLLVEAGQTYGVGSVLGYIEATEAEVEKRGLGAAVLAGTVAPAISNGAQDDAPSPATLLPLEAEEGERDRPHGSPDFNPPPWASGRYSSEPGAAAASALDRPLPAPAPGAGRSAGASGFLSPRVRARMSEMGLREADLAAIPGSGSGGRVSAQDLEKFAAELARQRVETAPPMRLAVADAMRRSWSRPLATVGRHVKLDAVLAHRALQSDPKAGPALYAVRALAIALGEDPGAAARLVGNKLVTPKAIDLGCAVEVDAGVMVPVLRGADRTPLREMVDPYRKLVESARKRTLAPDAFAGSVASVTNYGPFDLDWATPIPLPDETLILGMSAVRRTPEWDEEIEDWMPVEMVQLTLTFDHRVLDGGRAGRLMARIAALLQEPAKL